MPSKNVKKGLGRGLDALFASNSDAQNPLSREEQTAITASFAREGEEIALIKLIDLEPNKNQPRKTFNQEKLDALTESVKLHGVIQPLLVKPTPHSTYLIVAGERRFRAAKAAGIKEVPCIVKNFSERDVMEVSLIENLQREDLNPIEEAEGYKRLMLEFALTQEMISERVGKSRSAIANSLRLNNLPDEIKQLVVDDHLSTGHARALLGLSDPQAQLQLSERIIKEGLNVRQVEGMIADFVKKPKPTGTTRKSQAVRKYYLDYEQMLSERLRTKVKIHPGKQKSKIELEFYTREDFERIIELLNR